MDLSIIVVNWNTRELLQNCLCSIYAHRPQCEFEVVVIDNASHDGSPEMVQQELPQVRLIRNDKNSGFARANNQGIEISTGRYVLLLNSDTLVKPQALEYLVTFLDAHPEAGGGGSLLLNPDGTLQVSCYPFPTLRREFWRLFHLDELKAYGVYHMNTWDRQEPREVDHIKGASLVLRRAALDQVGLLDEDYFMYSEELDLCYRLKKASWKLYWLPKSVVVHFGGQSTKQAATEMFLELYRSKILYFRKNHPEKAGLYKWVLFSASVGRLILSPLVLLEKGSLRVMHKVIIHHYRRLIQELPRM